MSTAKAGPARRRRQNKACGRCRQRKIRCDFQYPKCGACSAAGATCLGVDSTHGSDKPRSIVHHLEEQAARLEIELTALQRDKGSTSATIDDAVEKLATRVATVILEPTGRIRKPEPLHPLVSDFFLSDSPLPPFDGPSVNDAETGRSHLQSTRAMAISSIPHHVVDAMLKHYCQTYRPQYPSIDEKDLYQARDRVYGDPDLVGYDAFVLCITLAISSNTLSHIDEKRAATTTHELWATAKSHLEHTGTTASWERLQALQLLTHYGFLNPQHVNVSHCAAAASRLAIQFGLHEELPVSVQMSLEPELLNTRRRMFWNAYGIDAATHSVRCQPFEWLRPEITVKFPDSENQSIPTHSAHMWSLREIESDITLGLCYPVLALGPGGDDSAFEPWRARMQARLQAWYQTIRKSVNLTERIEFHELLFQIQVLRLNRSSPRCPTPSKEMRKRALEASVALIKEFMVLDRMGKMFMLWHATHCTVEAAVYLLSSVLTSMQAPNSDRQRIGGEDIGVLARYIKAFPSLLWKISRRWPRVDPYASVLETISTSILEALQKWSEGRDVSEVDFVSLREQLEDLTMFPSTPPQPRPPTTVARQDLELEHGQSTEESSTQIAGHLYPIVAPSPFQQSGGSRAAPSINSDWSQSHVSMDPGFSDPPEAFVPDFNGPMAWDFSGLDSEEIFAALLDGVQPEALLLR